MAILRLKSIIVPVDLYFFEKILILILLASFSPSYLVGQDDTVYVDFDSKDIEFTPFECSYEVVINPDLAGINKSSWVGKVVTGRPNWDGIRTTVSVGEINFSSRTVFKMKVLAPIRGFVMMTLEDESDSANFISRLTQTEVSGKWVELEFDFKGAASGQYDIITIYFDYNTNTRYGHEWFFDEIVLSKAAVPDSLLSLPAIFGDNMVLQQNMQVPVWGNSFPGDNVVIEGNWGEIVTTVTDSNWEWSVNIKTPIAVPGEAPRYNLTVSGDANTVSFDSVLIGDVWLCSGQSNMEFRLLPGIPLGVLNYEEEIASADYPNIRLIKILRKMSFYPRDEVRGVWEVTSPQTVGNFGAVPYFFARELYNHRAVNIPIGLINISFGGSSVQAWTRNEILKSDPELKEAFFDPYVDRPHYKYLHQRPSILYNGMLSPVIPFGIKGAIWYQGEANALDGDNYRKLITGMVADWRVSWNNLSLPFYFVQVAPYNWPPEIVPEPEYAFLREAQLKTLNVSNTGMAVTTDLVHDLYDIHPRNKQDVGKRLALWALAKNYDQDIVYTGPIYDYKILEEGRIRIYFEPESIGGGLEVNGAGELTDFSIAGVDHEYYSANAMIDGESVIVWSSSVPKPAAVRFGWSNAPVPNLMNAEGLPASPFRTDDWVAVEDEPTASILPNSTELLNNYPNPFNPTTAIEYSLPSSGEVSLMIYNLLGQEVANLVSGRIEAGFHKVTWDASNYSSGIYFYRLQAGLFVQTRKMVLLK